MSVKPDRLDILENFKGTTEIQRVENGLIGQELVNKLADFRNLPKLSKFPGFVDSFFY